MRLADRRVARAERIAPFTSYYSSCATSFGWSPTNSVTFAASTIYATPVIVPEKAYLTGFAVWFLGCTTNKKILVCLYRQNTLTGLPGPLVGGSVFEFTTVSNALATVAVSPQVFLEPGIYWVAFNRSTETFFSNTANGTGGDPHMSLGTATVNAAPGFTNACAATNAYTAGSLSAPNPFPSAGFTVTQGAPVVWIKTTPV